MTLAAASLEMKFRPEPASRNTQNTSPFNLTGTIAGRVGSSVSGVYPVNTGPFSLLVSQDPIPPLVYRLVWCFAPQWKHP